MTQSCTSTSPAAVPKSWAQELQQRLRPQGLRSGAYIDNRIYTDATAMQAEKAGIFEKLWNFVCHESELPGPGDYRESRIADVSILLWRGDGGNIRAFVNACRHRSVKITREPSGTIGQLQCFYHLWTYANSGELVRTGVDLPGADLTGVARAKGYAKTGFDKCDFPLVELPCSTFNGLVFASLNPSVEPLTEFLGPLAEHIARVLPPELEVVHYHEADVATNWKLFSDNNREMYHVLLHYLNRKSAGYAGKDKDSLFWTLLPNGHATFGDPERNVTNYEEAGYGAGSGLTSNPLPGVGEGAQPLYYIFPDVMINIRSNVMRIDRMVPLSPGLTRVEWRGLALSTDSAEVRSTRLSNHNLVWGPLGRNLPEDLVAVEAQYKSMASGGAPYSVVAREENLAAMDDMSLREFYSEWSRRTGIPYDNMDRVATGEEPK